jgi:hypothetical protein
MKCQTCGQKYDGSLDFCTFCGDTNPEMSKPKSRPAKKVIHNVDEDIESSYAEEKELDEIERIADNYNPSCPDDTPYEKEKLPAEDDLFA